MSNDRASMWTRLSESYMAVSHPEPTLKVRHESGDAKQFFCCIQTDANAAGDK